MWCSVIPPACSSCIHKTIGLCLVTISVVTAYAVPWTSSSSCGTKPPQQGQYVIGGVDAPEGAWPWQVSFQFYNQWDGTFSHVCGGTLIGSHWVLAAAHCFDASFSGLRRSEPRNYKAVLGAHSLKHASISQQTLNVQSIIKHPNWEPSILKGFPNDIAIVELSSTADLSPPEVGVACLTESESDFNENDCWITGWGDTTASGSTTDILQQATSPIISQTTCASRNEMPVLNTHICVGDLNSPKACTGDSGGPLSCKSSHSDHWYLAGVASFSMSCSGHPSIYTRVSNYIPWISAVTGVGHAG